MIVKDIKVKELINMIRFLGLKYEIKEGQGNDLIYK